MATTLIAPRKILMRSELPTHSGAIRNYGALRQAVREMFIQGQKRLEAVKVELYWRTGQLIQTYKKSHREETEYGTGVTERLAHDLNIEVTVLYRILKFYNSFPILAPGQELTWTHYRELLTLSDEKKRIALAREAGDKKWNVRKLQQEIGKQQKEKQKEKHASGFTLMEPKRGIHDVRQVTWMTNLRGKRRKVIDLGFHVYQGLSASQEKKFRAEDVVQWRLDQLKWTRHSDADSIYFYQGEVERVVDGDTLRVQARLGFNHYRRQYLRLRGIDAPELQTPRGNRARNFLLNLFRKSATLNFKSRFTDRYGRYLSDVWVGDQYLNQLLLDRRLAEKY